VKYFISYCNGVVASDTVKATVWNRFAHTDPAEDIEHTLVSSMSFGAFTHGITVAIPVVVWLLALISAEISFVCSSLI
jgi:hypothetical protein